MEAADYDCPVFRDVQPGNSTIFGLLVKKVFVLLQRGTGSVMWEIIQWMTCGRKLLRRKKESIWNGKQLQMKLWLLLMLLHGTVMCEIEQLKNCGMKVLCRGKAVPIKDVKPSNRVLTGSNEPTCSCDKNCTEFGVCCMDNAPNTFERNGDSSWSCVPLSFNQSVYAVSNCAHNMEPLKRSCEKSVLSNDYNYIMDIPVYSNRTGLYYANIYCAYCQNQLSTVEYPRLSIRCSSNITNEMLTKVGKYQKGQLIWKVRDGFCSLFLHEVVHKGKPCDHSVSNCQPNSDTEPSAMCNAYALVFSDSQKIYRNPYCAICNDVNKYDSRCRYREKLAKIQDYSVISDFQWKFDKCNDTRSVWDNLHLKCRQLDCPGGLRCIANDCDNSDPNDLSCQIIQQLVLRKIDSYIMRICLSVSVVCLILHMVISIFFPQRKKVASKMFDSLALCLVVGQVLFLCGIYPLNDLPGEICYMLAVMIQFFFLASFFWMNAVSIDICYTFSDATLKCITAKKHSKFALYAWGSAALATIFSVVADFTDLIPNKYRPHYAARPNVCFFGTRYGVIIFFYVPVFFIVLLNTVMFTITVCWFQKQHRSSETLKTSGRREYNRLWLYIKLSTIMGASWVFGLIKFITENPIYRHLFTAFSGLQGAFILFMFDLKAEVSFVYVGFRGLSQRRSTDTYDQVDVKTSVRRTTGSVVHSV